MQKTILTLLLFLPLFSFSQNCDCTSNFEWVKKTFEENDAGFQFVIDRKGEKAYEQHNKTFRDQVSKIEEPKACTQVISKWLSFFRSGHVSIQMINQNQSQSEKKQSNQDIIDSFKDWDKIDVNLKEFKKYLSSKNKQDYEGIWVSEPYKIGIKKVGNEYLGFIIEADGVYWTKGQIKLRIKEDNSSVFYFRNHSGQEFKSVNLLEDNYLEIGSITLKRVFPKVTPNSKIEKYFSTIEATNPYFEEIDNETVLLRIPRFWGSEKKKIDSVINEHKAKILKTKNLIIDIRNNGGGSDNSFHELLPFLYTNSIRTVGVQFKSTLLNNQRMLDFINNDEYGFDEKGKKWAKESYDKLSKHIGEFVMLKESPVTETTFDTIHQYPKNIGIIINENNGSTTEQFLLAAKQSKKVKLFGTTTAGVLDISNMYFVNSPCNEFKLGYCLSKSMRIPEMTIDDKGIQPDYYIDKGIQKYKWVNYVSEILNK
ncbi:S41 family peptidase [Aquimarina rhabdastrellae]